MLELDKPEVRAVTATVDELVTYADGYTVTTIDEFEAGAEDLKRVKAAQKTLEDTRTAITKPFNAGLKAINDFFRKPADRLATVEMAIKRELGKFSAEQQRLQQEDQRRADEDARKERERLEAQAQRANNSGRTEKALVLEQRAASVVAPVINRAAPKVAGVSFRETWHAECNDLMTLVKAIADGKAPLSLVMANDKVIGAQARSLKKDFIAPGVRVWSDKNIAAGAA